MVPGGRECRRHASEDRPAVVRDLDGFSVNRFGPANDPSAEMLPDRLVPKANAEDRNFPRKPPNRLERDTRTVGSPGPGEITIFAGWIPFAISSTETSSLRTIRISAPSSPRYCTRL